MKNNEKTKMKYVEIPDAAGAGSDANAGADTTPSSPAKPPVSATPFINEGARFDEHDLISVIVPIYNAGGYLAPCLDSILAQTHTNLQVICLNDGSTDGSLDVLRAYEAKDPRIQVIDKANEGYGATCNRGLELAEGVWVSVIEPDDWIEPDMYADMLAEASQYTAAGRIDVIKTPYWRIWMPDTNEERKLNCSYRHRVKPTSQPFTIGEAAHLLTHHPSIWSAIYRKDFLDDFSIRFKPIPGAGWADNPFLIETLVQARGIVYLDNPYYCYREETPQKAHDSAVNQPLLPFDRWNDMMDKLEALGITDERILRAHYSRGFTYMSGVIQEVPIETPEVNDAIHTMFNRMNPDLVLSDTQIPPGCKELFIEFRGLDKRHIARLPYYAGLVGQGLYFLRNLGPEHTLYMTKRFFKNKAKREGQESSGADEV